MAELETASPRTADENELYLGLYRRMVLIRGFEDTVQSLFLKGHIHGTTHLCSGQEATEVGVTSLLRDGDRVAGTYRGHGHALGLGLEPQKLLDELLGRATGVSSTD
jgi:TPP-dependent pyruvate/acetoin dehydrogenase alpha subunit